MQTVELLNGVRWQFAVTLGLADDWKDSGENLDLYDKPEEAIELTTLQAIGIVWEIGSPVEGDKPDAKGFRSLLDGKASVAIVEAWRNELINFTRAFDPQKAVLLEQAVKLLNEMSHESGEQVRLAIEESKLRETLRSKSSEIKNATGNAIQAAINEEFGESQAS